MTSNGLRAGRLVSNIVQRVGAAARALGFIPNVLGGPEEVAVYRKVGGNFLLLQRPGGLRAVNLFKIGDARVLLTCRASLHEIRDGDRRKQTDDCDHNHDFNKGETAILAECITTFHTYLSSRRELGEGGIDNCVSSFNIACRPPL